MTLLILIALQCLLVLSSAAAAQADIALRDGRAVLRAESLERIIQVDANVSTVAFSIGGNGLLAERAKEFSVVITHEQSNRKPRGLRPDEAPEKNYFKGLRKGDTPKRKHAQYEASVPFRKPSPFGRK